MFVAVERRRPVGLQTQVSRIQCSLVQGRLGDFRFMIRDRDSEFTPLFDELFTTEGIRIVLTAPRVPRMNAMMERWVDSVRREC